MEGWQPIGTAPRDGRTILIYLPIGAGHPTRRQDDVIAVTWAGAFWARATGLAGWLGDAVQRHQGRCAHPLEAAARPAGAAAV